MINPNVCPFCKKENKCMVNELNNSCWCNDIKVPEDLKELIPIESRLKACICKECILSFKKDKIFFIKKFV